VSVAAASDLRYALDEVVIAFQAVHPDTEVTIAYGSSGSFHAQLVNGAPFDLFLSADIDYARQLGAAGVARADSLFTYAEGRLAVWVRSSSWLDLDALGLRALAEEGVRRVAIANPAHAPYGRAAEAALRSAGVYDAVKPKLVLGDNVSQALQFVESGAADVGVVALSLAAAPPLASTGRYVVVPATAHPRIEQGGVIMAAANGEGASRLRLFLLSQDGRAVLDRYGFAPPR
jgi:molybdate transport system substrate-binding protein